jgi:hypothetical protein
MSDHWIISKFDDVSSISKNAELFCSGQGISRVRCDAGGTGKFRQSRDHGNTIAKQVEMAEGGQTILH